MLHNLAPRTARHKCAKNRVPIDSSQYCQFDSGAQTQPASCHQTHSTSMPFASHQASAQRCVRGALARESDMAQNRSSLPRLFGGRL